MSKARSFRRVFWLDSGADQREAVPGPSLGWFSESHRTERFRDASENAFRKSPWFSEVAVMEWQGRNRRKPA
jgi:hypothetical protein